MNNGYEIIILCFSVFGIIAFYFRNKREDQFQKEFQEFQEQILNEKQKNHSLTTQIEELKEAELKRNFTKVVEAKARIELLSNTSNPKISTNKDIFGTLTSFDEIDLIKIQSLPEQVVFCGKVGQWYILKHTECNKWALTDNLEIMPLCWFWCLHSILRMKCIY